MSLTCKNRFISPKFPREIADFRSKVEKVQSELGCLVPEARTYSKTDGDISEGQWHQLEGTAAQMRTICTSQRIEAIKDYNTE